MRLIEFVGKVQTYLRRKSIRIIHTVSPNKKFRLAHVTYYSSSNVGDTVLSNTVRKGFNKCIGNVKWDLYDVSDEISDQLIKQYNRSNAIIIGGGGLFLPDTNKNSISGWQWPISVKQLSMIDSPIIIYSVGFNYFRGQKVDGLFRQSLVDIVEKSAFVGLRNFGSIREVKSLLPEYLQSKIVYQPCLTTIIRKLDYNLPRRIESQCVAYNVAFDRIDKRLGNQKDAVLHEIALSMKKIHDRGYKLFYVAHIVKDLEFIPYMKSVGVDAKVVNASSWSANRLIKFYNKMDLAAGMRGHAQMIPFGVNCHIITLGSHDKMRWFLEDIKALDWYVELTDGFLGLADKILEKFILIHERNKQETDSRLIRAQNNLYETTLKNFEVIEGLILSN